MTFLLDSDVIIDFLRGKKTIEENILKNPCSISIISYGELLYGAAKSANSSRTLNLVKNFIRDFAIHIISLDEGIMQVYANEKARLEIAGMRLDDFDLLIGSTAIQLGKVLVTGNKKHFQRMKNLTLF